MNAARLFALSVSIVKEAKAMDSCIILHFRSIDQLANRKGPAYSL